MERVLKFGFVLEMHELNEQTAADYLRQSGRVGPSEALAVSFLAGGVSNIVLLVERPDNPEDRFVLKQARAQLRVAEPWFCSVERIWRETAFLHQCETILQPPPTESGLTATMPAVLWEDRENYAFAMQAAPAEHTTWKARLLAGGFDSRLLRLCGKLLARLHARTWLDSSVAAEFADQTFFEDLRIDPYYRQVARVKPSLAPAIGELIASLGDNHRCLVHGDFSPKNLLVHADGLMLIDCEVGHYGDPAFDLGFMFTHLTLKRWLQQSEEFWSLETSELAVDMLFAIAEFLAAYREDLLPAVGEEESHRLEQRGLRNAGGCLLARMVGKSPVEYRERLAVERVLEVGELLLRA